jgi:hypothetical protein
MIPTFLTNQTLKNFLLKSNFSQKTKEILASKIPEMGIEEREKLFEILLKSYLLEKEEKDTLLRVKNFFKP